MHIPSSSASVVQSSYMNCAPTKPDEPFRLTNHAMPRNTNFTQQKSDKQARNTNLDLPASNNRHSVALMPEKCVVIYNISTEDKDTITRYSSGHNQFGFGAHYSKYGK